MQAAPQQDEPAGSALRPTLKLVVALNLGMAAVEVTAALAGGSVSLFADSVDFLEDASINLLVLASLDWSRQARGRLGAVMAAVLLAPTLATLAMAWHRFRSDTAPGPAGSGGPPGVGLRDHLLHGDDALGRVDGGKVAARDRLGVGVLAFQRQHERQVLPHPRVGLRLLGGKAQRLLGLRQLVLERVGQAHVGEHVGLVRADVQRRLVVPARGGVVAHLVGDGALRGEHAPARPVGRVRAFEHAGRLLQSAGVGQRLAVGGQHRHVVRVLHRKSLQHRNRLRMLAEAAQRLRVMDRGDLVVRVLRVARLQRFGIGAQRGRVGGRRRRSRGDGIGHRRHGGVAAGDGERQREDGRREGRKLCETCHAVRLWPPRSAKRSNKILTLTKA